jgi:hypothetical protein
LVNLRSLPVKRYVVFYQPTDDGVEIFREMRCIYEAGSVRQVHFARTSLPQPLAAIQNDLPFFGSESTTL